MHFLPEGPQHKRLTRFLGIEIITKVLKLIEKIP